MAITQKIPQTYVRLLIIGAAFLLSFLVLEFKLWREQLYRGEQYRERISQQSIRRIRLPSLRGKILSSDNVPLAENRPAFDVHFYLEEMRRPGSLSKTVKHILEKEREVASLIGRKPSLTEEDVRRHMNYLPGLPLCIFRDLSERERGTLHEHSPYIQGMSLEATAEREYPAGATACHLLGYIRKDDPQQANDRDEFSYYQPDQKGVSGLEKKYDSVSDIAPRIRGLRGLPGLSMVRVDHRGFIYETLGEDIAAENGSDIVLTINYKAQCIAESLLNDKKGAIVVMNADTGAVLAMASSPAFNMDETAPQKIGKLMKSKDSPMLNRAVNGAYAPGSIVKPLIGMALLENDISPYDTTDCNGYTMIGNARVRCTGHHGPVDLVRALQVSCNDYFVEHGMAVSIEKIREIMQSAGIGRKTGFPLPERSGILPGRAIKYRLSGNRWTIFDTALASIGQGTILVTPLQAAVFCSAIANGGNVMRPMLLQQINDRYGNLLYKTEPEITGKLKVSDANLKIVREGMYRVVNDKNGSGRNASNPAITLYGKTGTAEVGSGEGRYKNTWFIGFGTKNDVTYSIAILIEHGQSGGRSCAPLAAEFFIDYLAD